MIVRRDASGIRRKTSRIRGQKSEINKVTPFGSGFLRAPRSLLLALSVLLFARPRMRSRREKSSASVFWIQALLLV
jgi:hypothetical protein